MLTEVRNARPAARGRWASFLGTCVALSAGAVAAVSVESGAWAALGRLLGSIPLPADAAGPWPVVAELGLLCALVALVVAVAPASRWAPRLLRGGRVLRGGRAPWSGRVRAGRE
ncbi:hypothetical protein [Kitasatospora sp. LaBMicrA B282]|uniref:hypothetical protein n=1 Tax=Kitasatospora sp. LaBMicrA B282 TaxID=3420949 RepID=UPI003D09B117